MTPGGGDVQGSGPNPRGSFETLPLPRSRVKGKGWQVPYGVGRLWGAHHHDRQFGLMQNMDFGARQTTFESWLCSGYLCDPREVTDPL